MDWKKAIDHLNSATLLAQMHEVKSRADKNFWKQRDRLKRRYNLGERTEALYVAMMNLTANPSKYGR